MDKEMEMLDDTKNLKCDFSKKAKLEIKVYQEWCAVEWTAFRSWSGDRQLNGEKYEGPSYYYLSNEVA